MDPCVGKIPWRRKRQPTPLFLPGKSCRGQRSLEVYSPWGCKELDTTERLHFSLSSLQHHHLLNTNSTEDTRCYPWLPAKVPQQFSLVEKNQQMIAWIFLVLLVVNLSGSETPLSTEFHQSSNHGTQILAIDSVSAQLCILM